MSIYGMHTQRNLPIVVPEKPVVLYFQPPAPARDYGSLVPENPLQRLMQTVEAYQIRRISPSYHNVVLPEYI